MQFESEKIVGKMQDGLFYNALLSEINFVLYKTFITYLPFYGEIMNFDNHIWSTVIEELNKKGLSERVVSLYKDNKEFFEYKYGIKEKDFIEETDTLKIASIIYYKILGSITFASSKDDKKHIFGVNDSNIIPCPKIIKDQWLVLFNNVDYYESVVALENLVAQSFNLYHEMIEPSPKPKPPPPPKKFGFWDAVGIFFTVVAVALTFPFSVPGFLVIVGGISIINEIYDAATSAFGDKYLVKETTTQKDIDDLWQKFIPRYFFEKDYYDNYIKQNNFDATRGFHFETFVSFDFDRSKFDFSDNLIKNLKAIDKNSDYQGYLYSFLNTAYFLPNGGKPIQNIVVNPELFKQVFSATYVNKNSTTLEKQHQFVEPYLKKFISNVKVGLRMVYRLDHSIPGAKEYNSSFVYKYKSENEFINVCITDKLTIVTSQDAYMKATDSTVMPQTASIGFTQLEKKVIKDKSYLLYSKEGTGDKRVFTQHTWIPVVSVTTPKFTGEITYKNLNDFVDQQLDLEKLKTQLINKKEFKFIFERFIPTDMASLVPKTTDAVNKAVVLKGKMSKEFFAMDLLNPENATVYLAKTLEKTTETAIDSMLKDKQKEY